MGFFSSSKPKVKPFRCLVACSSVGTCIKKPNLLEYDPATGCVVAVAHGVPFIEVIGKDLVIGTVSISRTAELWTQERNGRGSVALASPPTATASGSGGDSLSPDNQFSTIAVCPGLPYVIVGKGNGTVGFYNWHRKEWSEYVVAVRSVLLGAGLTAPPPPAQSTTSPAGSASTSTDTNTSPSPAIRLLRAYPTDPNALLIVSDVLGSTESPTRALLKWYLVEKRSSAVFLVPTGVGSIESIAISEAGAYVVAGSALGRLVVWKEKDKKSNDRTCVAKWISDTNFLPPLCIYRMQMYSTLTPSSSGPGVASPPAAAEDGLLNLGLWFRPAVGSPATEGVSLIEISLLIKDKQSACRKLERLGFDFPMKEVIAVSESNWQSRGGPSLSLLGIDVKHGMTWVGWRGGPSATSPGTFSFQLFSPTTPWGNLEGVPQRVARPDTFRSCVQGMLLTPQRNPRLLGIAREPSPQYWPMTSTVAGDSGLDLFDLKVTDLDHPYCLTVQSADGSVACAKINPYTNQLVRGGGGVLEEPRYLNIVRLVPVASGMILIGLHVPSGDQPTPAPTVGPSILIFDSVTLSAQKIALKPLLQAAGVDESASPPADISVMEIVTNNATTLPNGEFGAPAETHVVDTVVVLRCQCNTLVLISLADRRVIRTFPAGLMPSGIRITAVEPMCVPPPPPTSKKSSPQGVPDTKVAPKWFLLCTINDPKRFVLIDVDGSGPVQLREFDKPMRGNAALALKPFRKNICTNTFQREDFTSVVEISAPTPMGTVSALPLAVNKSWPHPFAFSLGIQFEVLFASPLHRRGPPASSAQLAADNAGVANDDGSAARVAHQRHAAYQIRNVEAQLLPLLTFDFITPLGEKILTVNLAQERSTLHEPIPLIYCSLTARRSYQVIPSDTEPLYFSSEWRPINAVLEDEGELSPPEGAAGGLETESKGEAEALPQGVVVGFRCARDVSTGALTFQAMSIGDLNALPNFSLETLRDSADLDVILATITGCAQPRNPDGVFENGSLLAEVRMTFPVLDSSFKGEGTPSLPDCFQWPAPESSGGSKACFLAFTDDSGLERLRTLELPRPVPNSSVSRNSTAVGGSGLGTAQAEEFVNHNSVTPSQVSSAHYADALCNSFVVHAAYPSLLAVYPPEAVAYGPVSSNLSPAASADLRQANLLPEGQKILRDLAIEDVQLCVAEDGTPGLILVATSSPYTLTLLSLATLDVVSCFRLTNLPVSAVSLRIGAIWICGQLHCYVSYFDGITMTSGLEHLVLERAEQPLEKGEFPKVATTAWTETSQRQPFPYGALYEQSSLRSTDRTQVGGGSGGVETITPVQMTARLMEKLPNPPSSSASKEVGFFKSFVVASYQDQVKKAAEVLTPAHAKESFETFTQRIAQNPNLSMTEREQLLAASGKRQSTKVGGSNALGGKGDGIKSGMADTKNVMNENLQALHERGERIERLQKKTAWLEDDAAEFEDLCKQLKEKQRRSWWL